MIKSNDNSHICSVILTLALVNCTIGPSSDTTWFPTWMKGILPKAEQSKKTKIISPFVYLFPIAVM